MIFVDTSFWVALANDTDARHREAAELFAAHSGAALATSNDVRGETWTFVRRRFGHRAAVGLIDRLDETPRLHVLRAVPSDEQEAWAWLRRHDEREYKLETIGTHRVVPGRKLHDILLIFVAHSIVWRPRH